MVGLSELLNAFLGDILFGEQAGLLHHGEQLLSGELIKVNVVPENLLILILAILVFRIPNLETLEFFLRVRGGDELLLSAAVYWVIFV